MHFLLQPQSLVAGVELTRVDQFAQRAQSLQAAGLLPKLQLKYLIDSSLKDSSPVFSPHGTTLH